jgi:two-component system, cell cycle sensor histidine kinase and response regulator CckA
VLELARSVLQAKGYLVLTAPSGEEALQVCQRAAGEIDLLFTDLVLPGINGRELAEQIAATHGDVRVLYMSGYTDDAIVRHKVIEPGTAFLQKPFTASALARKVRETLS